MYTWQKSGNTKKLVEKKETFQYVPLMDTLASLMRNKDIYNEVSYMYIGCSYVNMENVWKIYVHCQISKPHQRDDGLIGDFCDGSLFKSHPLFQCDPLALQLITYYDEVEVCNPLGSHRGVNKLGKTKE